LNMNMYLCHDTFDHSQSIHCKLEKRNKTIYKMSTGIDSFINKQITVLDRRDKGARARDRSRPQLYHDQRARATGKCHLSVCKRTHTLKLDATWG
jgi:hypothetical protein